MRRLAGLTHSIRFRLTAWYGCLMILFMLLAGLGAWTLMGSWLRSDLDTQLRAAASVYNDGETLTQTLQESIRIQQQGDGPAQDAGGKSSGEYRSLVVQIDGNSGYAGLTPFDCQIPYDPPAREYLGTTRFSTVSICGDSFRVLAVNVSFLAQPSGVGFDTLILAQSLDPIDKTLGTLRDLMLAIGALGVVLAIQGGWFIAGRSLRPIGSVTATATAIAESPRTAQSLSARLEAPSGDDEVARLARTFNRMLDRVEAEFQRRQRFVGDASHELRTPLAAIRGNLDVLQMQLARLLPGGDGDARARAGREAIDEGMADLSREASRMARLLDDLLFLARSDEGRAVDPDRALPLRLDEVAAQVVRTASGMADGQVLDTDLAPVTVAGDHDRLAQLLWILLDNALRHTPAGAAVTVSTRDDGEAVVLTVADEGSGIAPDDLPHVFDRFYRADTSRGRSSGGSGLGLAIASAIVAEHGGTITAESPPGHGATFTVRLPRAAGPSTGLDNPGPDDAAAVEATVRTA